MDSLSSTEDGLPISKYRHYIIETVRKNQIVIIFGETGSGKTTQIPQYLLEADLNKDKLIGVTQPRRIAAISMARRLCDEMDCGLGMEVGYEVRFSKMVSNSTKIKFMTDGILLNQCILDMKLTKYGVIIIDEAHERSVNTDVLLGLLKMISAERKDLKIIITSATMNTTKFTDYFPGAPVFSVEGQMYKVEIIYRPTRKWVISHIVDIVDQIQRRNYLGHILIFLNGQEEIYTCCGLLENINNLVVLPLYGTQSLEDQEKVFQPVEPGKRKVIVATNIAETSITVNGIRFVIDSGFVKVNQYNPQTGIETVESVRISQSQADQRRGRAGRTDTGRCYRCYSNKVYEYMNKEITPDIYRRNLCTTYLKIVALGLDPMTFPFIDSPNKAALQKCLDDLQDLEFINKRKEITDMGKIVVNFPVDPAIGKVLINASKMECSTEIVSILAMLIEGNVFIRPSEFQSEADEKKKQFFDEDGDHFMLLNVFTKWYENNKSEEWCRDNFVNFSTIVEVDVVRDQLVSLMYRHNMPLENTFNKNVKECIKKAFISGFYKNICVLKSRGVYVNYYTNEEVYLHPGSCLIKRFPKMVLFQEVVKTSRPFMRQIMTLTDSQLDDFPNEKRKINYYHNS